MSLLFPSFKKPKAPPPVAVDSATERQLLEEARIYRRGVVSLRDIIAPSALDVESSFIRLNDRFVRTVFVTDYPRYISVGWFAPVINFNSTIDISLFIYPVRAEVILKQLKNKVGALEAQIVAEHEKVCSLHYHLRVDERGTRSNYRRYHLSSGHEIGLRKKSALPS